MGGVSPELFVLYIIPEKSNLHNKIWKLCDEMSFERVNNKMKISLN